MEEKGKGADEHRLHVHDEKKFFELIEQYYKEQGFELWEGSSSIPYREEKTDGHDVAFKERDHQNEQDGFKGIEDFEKKFAF